MQVSPISVHQYRNVGFEGKKKQVSNGHTQPSRTVGYAEALILLAPLLMSCTNVSPPSTQNTKPATEIVVNNASSSIMTGRVLSEKQIYSDKHGVVTVKTVNTKDNTNDFDDIWIKVGNDNEGIFGDHSIRSYGMKIDVYLDGRFSLGAKEYELDEKLDNYLNGLLQDPNNKTSFKALPGKYPTNHIDITEVPRYASYKELASRQFADAEGNNFLVNLYNDKGDLSYFNKAMLFVLTENDAVAVDVQLINTKDNIVLVSRADGKYVKLENAEITKYLYMMGSGGGQNREDKAYTITD